MFTRDYIIRLIEQIGAFLARIARLERDGQYEAGLREVERGYEALLDMDRRLFDVANSSMKLSTQ